MSLNSEALGVSLHAVPCLSILECFGEKTAVEAELKVLLAQQGTPPGEQPFTPHDMVIPVLAKGRKPQVCCVCHQCHPCQQRHLPTSKRDGTSLGHQRHCQCRGAALSRTQAHKRRGLVQGVADQCRQSTRHWSTRCQNQRKSAVQTTQARPGFVWRVQH